MRYYSTCPVVDSASRAHTCRRTFTPEAFGASRTESDENDAAPTERRRRRAPAPPQARRRPTPRRLRRRRAPRPHGGKEVSAAEILLRRTRLAALRGHLPPARILPDARRKRNLRAPRRRDRRRARARLVGHALRAGQRQRHEDAPRHRGAFAEAAAPDLRPRRHLDARAPKARARAPARLRRAPGLAPR